MQISSDASDLGLIASLSPMATDASTDFPSKQALQSENE